MSDYLRVKDLQFSRRITEQMLLYWHDIRGEKTFPAYSQIDLKDNDEIGGDSFIIKIHKDDGFVKYIYEFLGERIIKSLGGSSSSSVLSLVSNLSNSFLKVLQTAKPVVEESEFIIKGVEVKFRLIALPISEDEKPNKIGYILGGIRMKEEDVD